MWFIVNADLLKFFPSLSEADNSLTAFPVLLNELKEANPFVLRSLLSASWSGWSGTIYWSLQYAAQQKDNWKLRQGKQPAYVIAVLKAEYSERMRGPKSGPESGWTERQKRRK